MKVRIEYGNQLWEGDLPDNDFLLVASTYTEACEAIQDAVQRHNGYVRHWKTVELAHEATDALMDLPLGHPAKPLVLPSENKIDEERRYGR